MKKRILPLLLIIALLINLLPATAAAANSGSCGSGVRWSYDTATKTLTISGSGRMNDYDYSWGPDKNCPWNDFRADIKAVVVENGVSYIGQEAFGSTYSLGVCEKLSSLQIAASVTEIGRYAFTNAESLTELSLSEGLKTIAVGAFKGTRLARVTIPKSVTTIGDNAFADTQSLYAIDVESGNSKYSSVDGVLFETVSGGVKLCQYPLAKMTTAYTAPDTVLEVDEDAFSGLFSGNQYLKSVTFKDGLTELALRNFEFNESLSVTLPATLTKLYYSKYSGGREGGTEFDKLSLYFTGGTAPDFQKYQEYSGGLSGMRALNVYYPEDATGWAAVIAENKSAVDAGDLYFSTWKPGEGGQGGDSEDAPVTFNSGTAAWDIRFKDDEFMLRLNFTLTEKAESYGASFYDMYDNPLTGIDALDKDVPLAAGTHNCLFAVSAVDKNGNYTNRLAEGVRYYWQGYVVCDGVKYKSPEYTFIYSSEGSSNINTEPQAACRLSELTSLDYLAFSKLAYTTMVRLFVNNEPYRDKINEYLQDISLYSKKWSGNITYGELCAHIGEWRLVKTKENKKSGFYAAAFENDNGELVISYRGSTAPTKITTLDWWADWVKNDINMLLNGEGSQVGDAIGFYEELRRAGYSDIALTGHSLGGGLADIVSAYSGSYCESFNAAPFLDVAYWYYPGEMLRHFTGTDRWNFYDHINIADTLVGMLDKEHKRRIEHKNTVPADSAHSLESFVYKNSSGELVMTSSSGTYNATDSVWRMSNIGYDWYLYLGSSGGDNLSAVTKRREHCLYGGNGRDGLYGSEAGDKLIGGSDIDELDGGYGSDKYYYRKGDDLDIIHDISGKDELHLLGFSSTDTISVSTDSGALDVRCNNSTIVSIYTGRAYSLLNSNKFTLYVEKAGNITATELTKYLSERSYVSRYVIACPVDLEVIDEASGATVLHIDGGRSGAYYTDYGNFYVTLENNDYIKTADLIDGYSIRLRGTAAGSMDIAVRDSNGSMLSNERGLKNVRVTAATTAHFTYNAAGKPIGLAVDRDGDGVTDEVLPLKGSEVEEEQEIQISFVINDYTLSFDTRGGSRLEPVIGFDNSLISLDGCVTVREGWEFTGWYADEALTVPLTSVRMSEDTTIYAGWRPLASMDGFKLRGVYRGYSDVDESLWYGTQNEGAVRVATLLGLVEGYGDGRFGPEDALKVGEAIKIACLIHSGYMGGGEAFLKSEPWYESYVNYAIKNGIIEAGDFTDYEAVCTRAEAAYILAHALPVSELTALSLLTPPDIARSDKYGKEIYIFYAAGILSGMDEANAFGGAESFTRAQAAAIAARLCLPEKRLAK